MSGPVFNLDMDAFQPTAIGRPELAFNRYMLSHPDAGPKWYKVGAKEYRRLQSQGKTRWPEPPKIERASNITIPSRSNGRQIECRLLEPQHSSVKGVVMHMHGGGWVLGGSHWFGDATTDNLLAVIADAASVAVLSVGYRLAPEHPFPAASEDCFDVAEYLVDNAEDDYGAPLQFIMGESSGATMTAQCVLHLLEKYPEFELSGALMTYGLFDLSILPSLHQYTAPLMMGSDELIKFVDAYVPGKSPEEKRDPSISPIYHKHLRYPGTAQDQYNADGSLKKRDDSNTLPPALFLTGTADALIDDQMLMAARWRSTGADAQVKFVPGAPQGFVLADPRQFPSATKGWNAMVEFIQEYIEGGDSDSESE